MSIVKRSVILAAAAAMLSVCATGYAQPAARVLKMQSSWPASSTAQDHFKLFAERVEKL